MSGKMVQLFLQRLAEEKRNESTSNLKGIKSLAEWEERREFIKKRLIESLGGLPETGECSWVCSAVVEREEYTIENVKLDGLEGMPINLNIFIPKNAKPPFQTVVFTTGHLPKTHEMHQFPVMGLVKQGVLVALFDCWGRGEREYGNEHFTAGVLSWLNGRCMNRYFIYDSFKVVDYLYTREDVDKARILCTGASGGGNTAIFHAALDERVSTVAAACTISSFSDLINFEYSGCPEYYPIGLLGEGIDIQDIMALIAPRRFIMIGGGKDELNSCASLKKSYEHIRYVYQLYEKPHNISYYIDENGEHGYGKNMREAMYRWFNLPGNESDEKTEEAQVLNFLDGAENHLISYEYKDMKNASFCANIKKVLGLQDKPIHYRKISEKKINEEFSEHIIETDEGIFIPIKISKNIKEPILYISSSGGDNELCNVFPEIRGTGASSFGATPWDSLNYCSADRAVSSAAIVLGFSVCAQRVYDLMAVSKYICDEFGFDGKVSIHSDKKMMLTAKLFEACTAKNSDGIEKIFSDIFEYAKNNAGAGIGIDEQICPYESIIPGITGVLGDDYAE